MRGLIRLALFLVARLGLLFAIAVWIGSQWWYLQLNSDFRCVVTIYPESSEYFTYKGHVLEAVFHPDELTVDCQALEGEEVLIYLPYNDMDALTASAEWTITCPGFKASLNCQIPGLVRLYGFNGVDCIAVEHWFIVTVFALFYAVLKWVYRKRDVPVAEQDNAAQPIL